MTGTIVKALSGFYYVNFQGKTYECKARGSFRKGGVSPLVGDRVEFEATEESKGIINKIFERKNFIERPPVANIDKLFIISSYTNPSPNTLLIDKMTVIARYNDIEPIIVFNKSDMGDFSEIREIYERSGFKTYTVSALNNDGITELKGELEHCISAFTGNSGVGKSSILNSLFERDIIKTGDISEKLGRGRHTTRHTELYEVFPNSFVADTPGFSTFEADITDYKLKEMLPELFFDFKEYLPYCKFSSCTHTSDNGCAVLDALKEGKIQASRHNSYIELFKEMKDLKPWEAKKR